MNDRKFARYLILLLFFPLALGMCSNERFRYPCQDPDNWDKEICQKPLCDVTRSCPEHIFKGQRDPRLGPLPENTPAAPAPSSRNCK
jgi:hypothetical protein